MNPLIDNPFLITGYESPKYFCDREVETKELYETLRNGRNVTLTSPRRMGKSALIKHLFYTINQQEPKAVTIYIDLYPTECLFDFTKAFAAAILGQLDSNPVKVLKKATAIFRGLRPFYSVDSLTGQPKVGFDFVPGSEEHTLEQVFSYLNSSGKTCYIALDEFQQIGNYPEKNIEAILRSYIQDLHNVHFIFSGSQKHMLEEMFHSPKRPFYQSSSEKNIDVIDYNRYYSFAAAFFNAQGREMPEPVFNMIFNRYEGYTGYIQIVLNRLYSKSNQTIDSVLAEECISDILQENNDYYMYLLRAYSRGQGKLMKAIAKEKKVKEITSGSFISKYNLSATSSVKSALSRLLDEEIVYHSEEGYTIYDRFFGEWLATRF